MNQVAVIGLFQNRRSQEGCQQSAAAPLRSIPFHEPVTDWTTPPPSSIPVRLTRQNFSWNHRLWGRMTVSLLVCGLPPLQPLNLCDTNILFDLCGSSLIKQQSAFPTLSLFPTWHPSHIPFLLRHWNTDPSGGGSPWSLQPAVTQNPSATAGWGGRSGCSFPRYLSTGLTHLCFMFQLLPWKPTTETWTAANKFQSTFPNQNGRVTRGSPYTEISNPTQRKSTTMTKHSIQPLNNTNCTDQLTLPTNQNQPSNDPTAFQHRKIESNVKLAK